MGRILTVCCFLIVALMAQGTIFWKQELKYQLLRMMPLLYKEVAVDTLIETATGRAYFPHFYNPECPCWSFSGRHVKSLIRQFGDSVYMVIAKDLTKALIEFIELNFIVDDGGTTAAVFGVSSTPQAVIIDDGCKWFYRGNYNQSRYCTTKAANFAELALVELLNNQPSPMFGLMATQAYGCEWGENDKDFELF